MATIWPTHTDPKYINWVKGGLGLKFAKDGIENFVESNIVKFHNSVLTNQTCNNCSTENIIPCVDKNNFCKFRKNKCTVHNPNDPNKKSRLKCPKSVCDKMRDEIVNHHRFRGPTWVNTDGHRWCQEPWQLATCYMPTGYAAANSAQETDFPGLLSVIINNKTFDTEVSENLAKNTNVFCKARDTRNSILHNADMKLSDTELAGYIATLDSMLLDSKCLAVDPNAIQARSRIAQILNGTLRVTNKDEYEVRCEAIKAIEEKANKALAAVSKQKEDAINSIKLETGKAETSIKTEKISAVKEVNEKEKYASNLISSKTDAAVTAVHKEKDKAILKLGKQTDEVVTTISKEKEDATNQISSKTDDAVMTISKDTKDATNQISSKTDYAVMTISKETKDATNQISSKADEAVFTISKEKEDAKLQISLKTAAIDTEKEKAIKEINSKIDMTKIDESVAAAVNKAKQIAVNEITSRKNDAIQAVTKEKGEAASTIISKTYEAVAGIKQSREDLMKDIRIKTHKALTAIDKEKHKATNKGNTENTENTKPWDLFDITVQKKVIPFLHNLGSMYPGKMIAISGIPLPNSDNFQINLQCGTSTNDEIAFHFGVRRVSTGGYIVRNTHTKGGGWGTEEMTTPYFPFSPGTFFDMIIIVEEHVFKVTVNNQHLLQYSRRIIPLNLVDTIHIFGDLRLTQVRMR